MGNHGSSIQARSLGALRTVFLAAVIAGLAVISTASPDSLGPSGGPYRMQHAQFDYYLVGLAGCSAGRDAECHDRARLAARELGMVSRGQVGHVRGHYLFETPRSFPSEEASLGRRSLAKRLDGHPSVSFSSKQEPRRRLFKRSVYTTEQIDDIWANQLGIKDPGAQEQWHLYNRETPANDVNVTGVWLDGDSGKGVVVSIIDDGLDYTSPDLKDNFFLEGSWDFNGDQNGKTGQYPTPQLSDDRHGTRCAAEIAAERNNICGVGVAFSAKVSGIRILSADITEVDEAAAITFGYQKNQIYSCSWGPADDGQAAEGPPAIVAKAFEEGIRNGRGGLGSIYVFATGNGGNSGDNCNYDGYTNSIWTITIGAIDRWNGHPSYAEKCTAQLAVTYSSGYNGMRSSSIYTTDVGPEGVCTNTHGGTSAAAPLAAGILALALAVRQDLSWRDMQRLTMETAVPISTDDPGWSRTAAGRLYNIKFGYGKLDAYALVARAKTWKNLGPQTHYQTPIQAISAPIPPDGAEMNRSVTVTRQDISDASFLRFEHVTVTVNIDHMRRGELDIRLVSPNGVVSELGPPRPADASTEGLRNWTFSTVKHWDEDPVGTWTLSVRDTANNKETGTLLDWTLTIWGEAVSNGSTTLPPVASPSPSGPPIAEPSPPVASPSSGMSVGAIFGVTAVVGGVLVGGVFAYRWYRRRRVAAGSYEFQMLGSVDADLEGAFAHDGYAEDFGVKDDSLADFLDEDEDDQTAVPPNR